MSRNGWRCFMVCSGLSHHQRIAAAMINHRLLRAAQNKAVIARYLQDGAMWLAANEQMKAAAGMPWYRRGYGRA